MIYQRIPFHGANGGAWPIVLSSFAEVVQSEISRPVKMQEPLVESHGLDLLPTDEDSRLNGVEIGGGLLCVG